MKKAPTYNSLALGSIRARKRQYVTLITGIILAIFFTSSMLLIGQSIYHTYQERQFRQVGRQDAVMLDAEDVSPQELLESGYVKSVGNIFIIGETEGSETAIAYYDEEGEALANKQCVQGRMPEAVGEIAVERSKLQRLRRDAQLGDTLTLSLKVPGGNGFLPDAVTKTYTLVGILSEQTTYQPGNSWNQEDYLKYPGAMVSREEQVEAGGRPVIHRLLQLAPLVTNKEFYVYNQNTLHHNWIDTFDLDLIYENESSSLLIFVGILGMVLILVACMGIIGAFSMMLSERRAQIGMLRAVGATRRQVRRIFGREALVIALIVSPAAILLSHLAVWGLCKVLDGGLLFYSIAWFLPLELLLSIAFVMGAAFIPLVQASRVSPMQAIRETSLLRAKKRMRVRIKQAYWPPSLLARRHMRLYRAKQAGVWVVTALGLVILTLGVDMAVWSMRNSGPRSYDFTIETYWQNGFVEKNALRPLLTEGDLMEAAALPQVENVRASKAVQVNLLVKSVTEYLTGRDIPFYTFGYLMDDAQLPGERDQWQEAERKRYLELKNWLGIETEMAGAQLSAISPEMVEMLRPCVLSGEIDIDALNAGREVLIVAPEKIYMQYQKDDSGKIIGYNCASSVPQENEHYDKVLENDMFYAGNTLSLCRLYTEGGYTRQVDENGYDFDAIHRVDRTVRIGAVLSDSAPWEIGPSIISGDAGALITTLAGLDALGFETSGYRSLTAKMMSNTDEQTIKYTETALSDISKRAGEMDFYSSYESMLEGARWDMMITVMLFAISILFFTVCVSMVNNAVTGRIRSDKRAIGTLRAVGAPLRVIISTYLRQVGVMLGWGIAAGVLLSAGILAYQAYLKNFRISMMLPLCGFAALYILLILLFCGLNLRARIRGIVRSSIIDNIREQ